jgi:signal transduction histidine kinase
VTEPPFTGAIPVTLAELETVAATILRPTGEVVAANAGFRNVADENETEDAAQLFRQPPFEELTTERGEWTLVHEGFVNLGDPAGDELVTFEGRVHARADRIVVFAERDLAAEEKLRERVMSLNDELNEAQREMRRELKARRQAERAIEEKAADLERSNELLQEFAYVVSHDLQEPLRMVTSYLQLLESDYGDELDEDAHEYIDYAVDGAARMRDMIDALLAYSRVGSRGVDPEPVALSDVVDAVLEDLHVRIEEIGAEVHAEDLATVEADEGQLRHLLQNLIANALDHGGPAPTIELGAEPVEGTVRLTVVDDGPGIPEEEQGDLFGIFNRGSKASGDGTGIGLAVCQRIADRHGGEIGVESTEGQGATFWVQLPAGRTDGDGTEVR